jgi:hypothetical protein
MNPAAKFRKMDIMLQVKKKKFNFGKRGWVK